MTTEVNQPNRGQPTGETPTLDFHELLGRPPLPIDIAAVARRLVGKRILVTGAGGSIGSCLVDRVSGWQPAELVMLDNYEHSLYDLQTRLGRQAPHAYYLADVRDGAKMRRLFARHRPEVVIHLAAYKHVPLGEENPCETTAVNVLGTLNVVQAAAEAGVGTLVYTSTDKAVYPPSVYGATKRAVEILLRAYEAQMGGPRCVVVRLVNAVGAQGGVIRVFARQIMAGEPLTLTHEGMTRYWMSMDEAAQIAAQAACVDDPVRMVVPDVGPPVRLTAVAQRMQELLRPEAKLAVTITGMRPGERLAEKLIRDDEALVACSHPGLRVVQDHGGPRPTLAETLEAVVQFAGRIDEGDDEGLRRALFDFVSG